MSLKSKLALGFAIPVLFLFLLIYTGIAINDQVLQAFARVTEANLPLVRALETLKFATARTISATSEFMLDSTLSEANEEAADSRELDVIAASLQLYSDSLVTYRQLVERYFPEQLDLLMAVESSGFELQIMGSHVIDLINLKAPLADLITTREELERIEEDILGTVDTALAVASDALAGRQNDLREAVARQVLVELGMTGLALILTAAAGIFIFFSIARPVGRLKVAADSLTQGHLTARADILTADEIGQVGNAFNNMADRIAGLVASLEQRVTEAQLAREQAERSDRVKSAFLASMSHELRTPLNSILNYTRFVSKGVMGPVNERQVETLGKVVESGKHLLGLINDVLDISKIESGSLSLFVEDNVDLGDILRSAIGTTDSLLEGRPVEVKVEIDPELPLMRADKHRLRQIFLNILSNACKFTEQGLIQVRAQHRNGEIQVSIQDSGPGIAPEDHTAVFEAFRQTETGLRQGGGTGLGMPISLSLAQAHGGRLWFESEPGKGSTFYVALPVKSEKLIPVLA